jgi:hypothetical protein
MVIRAVCDDHALGAACQHGHRTNNVRVAMPPRRAGSVQAFNRPEGLLPRPP